MSASDQFSGFLVLLGTSDGESAAGHVLQAYAVLALTQSDAELAALETAPDGSVLVNVVPLQDITANRLDLVPMVPQVI